MAQPARIAGLALRWKLPLLVGGLVALLTGASLVAAWYEVRQSAMLAARDRLASVTGQFARQLESQATAHLQRAAQAASLPPVVAAVTPGGTLDSASLQQALLTETIIAAELLAADGSVVWEGGRALDAVRELEEQSLRGSSFGGEGRAIGVLHAIGDTLVFPVVSVVRDGEVRLGYLARWVATPPNPATPQAVTTLVGLGARLYVGSPGGAWSNQAEVTPPPPIPVDSLGEMQTYDRAPHGRQLAAGARVTTAPWMIVTEFPVATIVAPAASFLRRGALGAAFLLACGVVGGALLTRRVTRPLGELTEAADRLAGGERNVRVQVRRGDELGRLGIAFNTMATEVETEAAAREAAEAQWRLLFAENPLPMWVVDLETLGFLAVNEAAVERYGWRPDEWATMTLRDIRPPEDHVAMQEMLDKYAGGGMRAALVRHRDREGRTFDVELNGREVTFRGRHARLVMGLDVTERRLLEEQLRQAQKMEAVGRLAGGVAHDFNNALAVITACAELTAADLRAAGQSVAQVEEILRAANQAHALTRQLLTFSRQQVTRPEVLDPNHVAEEVGRMARRLVEEEVRVAVELDPGVSPVRADPGQLQQVVLNLVVNARDAIAGDGRITIATAMRDVEPEMIASHGIDRPGRFVVISVHDTGSGIPPEIRSRIFDPFFTTKPVGKGTGLGLATAYGIIAAAGGAITVYSEVGAGSTFRVYLPAADPNGVSHPTPTATPALARGTGDEVVLLVEDDVAVRNATATVLARLGYEVVAAETPLTALAIAADPSRRIDLVLSDVVMPEMAGPALVERLRAARPGLRAILMSGYAGDAVASRGVEASLHPFLEKPFTISALATLLRAELDRA